MKKHFLLIVSSFVFINVFAQNDTWNHKKCAVVLTYDDAITQHLDNAIPVLDSLGLKATFYLSGYYPGFRNRIADWKKAAANGHELGNHTLFHPCNGNLPGREWVNPDYDLIKYSIHRIEDEIRMTNALLQSLDKKTKRTFAFPCAETKIHDTAYIDGVRNEFIALRNVRSEMLTINKIDLSDVGCYMISGQSGEEMIALVKQAMAKHTLIVFLFHGVEGGNPLNVSLAAHSQLLHFLKQNQKDIWVAPMLEVAGYIQKYQHNK